MNRYAAETTVPVDKSKRVIEQLLREHGADAYHTGWDQQRDIIEFIWRGNQIRFVLPRPDPKDYTKTSAGRTRVPSQISQALDQANRQRWRALYLVIRAKLEAVEAGIS